MSLDKRIAGLERKVCAPASGAGLLAAYLTAREEARMRLREERPGSTPTQAEVCARMTLILRSWGYELSDRWYQGGERCQDQHGRPR